MEAGEEGPSYLLMEAGFRSAVVEAVVAEVSAYADRLLSIDLADEPGLAGDEVDVVVVRLTEDQGIRSKRDRRVVEGETGAEVLALVLRDWLLLLLLYGDV